MTSFVCLGDSFTEGMSDRVRPDGRYVGWADRTAAGLAAADLARFPAPIAYANLAVRGKLLRQVIAEQLPVALALSPDLVTFHAGPNDVLRPGTDVDDLARSYARAVAQLAQTGATVVLFTSLARAGGSGRFADRLEARFAAFNRRIRTVAARHGCVLVDDEAVHALTDRRFWADDRLHLNSEGHRRVAANVLHCLGVDDPDILGGEPRWWEQMLPPAPPVPRTAAVASDARWARDHFAPWLVRRLRGVSSGDGLAAKDPQLRPVEPVRVRTGPERQRHIPSGPPA